MYQTPKAKSLDRADHVWFERRKGGWKCLLCGAVTDLIPPDYPTDKDWIPARYDKLTKDERALAPFNLDADDANCWKQR